MEVESALQQQYDDAFEREEQDAVKSIAAYSQIVQSAGLEPEDQKVKENAIYRIGELNVKLGRIDALRQLLIDIRPFFAEIPKSRTAKIVRTLIDLVAKVPNSDQFQAELCRECIEWCKVEKRTFLRQRIEARLAALLLAGSDFKAALKLLEGLLREVKKLDDKLLLVELHLLESKIHQGVKNFPKAKAALISSRAASNAIYCPPALQAQIDMQAGTLCAEEKDYKTGYSYFFESFEGFNTLNDTLQAALSLKYMLLCKIMTNSPSDVHAIVHGKAGIKYAGADVDAMRALAEAHKERSLKSFQSCLQQYKVQLQDDPVISAHIVNLYEALLDANMLRILEPFSRVQIAHVAKLIDLPLQRVEAKLSEMILDKKLNGILDQGAGDLILYESSETDKTYEDALSTVKEMGSVLDKLYTRANKLN